MNFTFVQIVVTSTLVSQFFLFVLLFYLFIYIFLCRLRNHNDGNIVVEIDIHLNFPCT
jgi:uncharacterized membrane protein YqhA